MARWTEVLATQPVGLSSTLSVHTVEGENWLPQLSSDHGTYAHMRVHAINVKIVLKDISLITKRKIA